MIKAYNLETKELLGKYKTQQEVADAFDLTWEAVKGYFYRKKIYGDAKILNHKTGVWCYLVRENDIKKPNYKDRCWEAIKYILGNRIELEIDHTLIIMNLDDTKEGKELLKILGGKE